MTDHPGEPADTVNGGRGHDRIYVRDGEPDRVTCGPGNDRVMADYRDDVAKDCERVDPKDETMQECARVRRGRARARDDRRGR